VKAAGSKTVMSEVTMVASIYNKLEGNTGGARLMRLLESVGRSGRRAEMSTRNFDMDSNRWEHAAG